MIVFKHSFELIQIFLLDRNCEEIRLLQIEMNVVIRPDF